MSVHHARLFFSASREALKELILECQVTSEVTLFEYQIVAISDVKKLILTAHLKPTQMKTRTLVIVASGIALEAQQALLKILEEPPLTTKFVLWLSSAAVLLPTLRSRLSLESLVEVSTSAEDNNVNQSLSEFLNSNYAKRIEDIALATKNKDLVFLSTAMTEVTRYLVTSTNLTTLVRTQILWCLSQLELRGASKKMIWEEIALLLPVEANQ